MAAVVVVVVMWEKGELGGDEVCRVLINIAMVCRIRSSAGQVRSGWSAWRFQDQEQAQEQTARQRRYNGGVASVSQCAVCHVCQCARCVSV